DAGEDALDRGGERRRGDAGGEELAADVQRGVDRRELEAVGGVALVEVLPREAPVGAEILHGPREAPGARDVGHAVEVAERALEEVAAPGEPLGGELGREDR